MITSLVFGLLFAGFFGLTVYMSHRFLIAEGDGTGNESALRKIGAGISFSIASAFVCLGFCVLYFPVTLS